MMSSIEIDKDIFIGRTKHCANKKCKKPFIVSCPDLWTYKLKNNTNSYDYYCCYSHWMEEIRKRESGVRQKEERQDLLFKEKKRRENKRRRERKNGHSQHV
jgi:hypothetical protein